MGTLEQARSEVDPNRIGAAVAVSLQIFSPSINPLAGAQGQHVEKTLRFSELILKPLEPKHGSTLAEQNPVALPLFTYTFARHTLLRAS